MPLTEWRIGRALQLEPGMAVGLILVASCPSGTDSSVVSYLAKLDVALAVSVTTTSTLFTFRMTPLWCKFLAGQAMPVDASGLCISTLKAVVAPVLIGLVCNWKFPGVVTQSRPQIGTWLSPASPAIAKLAALCGFDWVMIDIEHGSAPESTVLEQLRALRGTTTKGIVRVPSPRADLIDRMLAWGADGIIVPHVHSAQEAASIVESTSYPTLGKRGGARTVDGHAYGLRSPDTTPRLLVVAPIETSEAVCAAHEIASTNGVDILFIDPADLQLDLKVRPQAKPLTYFECRDRVVHAARAAGKSEGILLRDAGVLKEHCDLGFNHIAVDGDLSILRKAHQATLLPSQQPI